MANFPGRPSVSWFSRTTRSPKAWKVLTVTAPAADPASFRTRSFISSAALLVNVTASTCRAGVPRASSQAMRCAITRVFPDPAPASTSRGPSVAVTA